MAIAWFRTQLWLPRKPKHHARKEQPWILSHFGGTYNFNLLQKRNGGEKRQLCKMSESEKQAELEHAPDVLHWWVPKRNRGGGRTRTHDSKAKTPEMNLMQWSFCSTTHQILCRVQGADDFTWSGFMVGFWVLG